MDPATVAALVQLGLKLAQTEIERRSNKKLADMKDDELLHHISEVTAQFHAKTMHEMGG